MIEKILKEINRLKKELNGYSASEALDYIEAYINTLSEEPVSEDLGEEIERCWKEMFPNGWSDYTLLTLTYEEHKAFAHHFAEWQKQKDEKLFNEDTWNYIEEQYPDVTKEEKLRLYDVSIKSRLAGANTIKQQMKGTIQKPHAR